MTKTDKINTEYYIESIDREAKTIVVIDHVYKEERVIAASDKQLDFCSAALQVAANDDSYPMILLDEKGGILIG